MSQSRLADNLLRVQQQIADAAQRSGRTPEEVRLIGVTKYVDAELTRQLFDAGCRTLGESRPQQLWDKAEQLDDSAIEWHLIGHLQRNKARRILKHVRCIHSVDSLRLLASLDDLAAKMSVESTAQVRPQLLLEVNISGESAKHGFSPAELPGVIEGLASVQGVEVSGLMAMAGLAGDQDDARREFAEMRQLRDRLVQQGLPGRHHLTDLSMGMSGDYSIAIEEGSTMVRVGSALFEGLR